MGPARLQSRRRSPLKKKGALKCAPTFTTVRPAFLRRDFDVDRARLRFLAERQRHGEHAVLVFGRDARRVNRRRQRERPAERAIRTLDAMELLLLDVILELALAFQRQRAVLEHHLDVLALHVRQFRLEHELLLAVFEDVHGRYPAAVGQQVSERIETNNRHGYLASANSASTTSPSLAVSAGLS